MPEIARVAAVVPVYNRAGLLRRMLETAAAQTFRFSEIIAVDNASTDDAIFVAREFGCRVIQMPRNVGFAPAVNAGWKSTRAEWIAVLNSDVELDPCWLESLICAATRINASFATGLILNAADRNTVDGTYDLVSRAGCAWRAGHGDARRPDDTRPVSIAPGTACIFRRDVLEQTGGYDESFESYLEDVDLGLRCIERGFGGIFVPAAIAFHHGSATLGRWNARVVWLISRNQVRLIAKHYDAALLRRWWWPIVTGQLLWGLVAARHGAFFPWIAGKLEGIRGFRCTGPVSPKLERFIAQSEAEIRERAQDSYWRWYFRLTGHRSAAN